MENVVTVFLVMCCVFIGGLVGYWWTGVLDDTREGETVSDESI